MNPDLKDLHSMLGTIIADLSARLGNTTDPNQAQALLLEMKECVHRLDLLQQIMFVEVNDEIATEAAAVKVAAGKVQATLSQIGAIATVVNRITSFLGQLDHLIDLAKKVAVM